MRTKIYLASRYSRRQELIGYGKLLEDRGYDVPARWLKGEHQVEGLTAANEDNYVVPNTLAEGFALDDLQDMVESDVMINFTEPPRTEATRGGRHVEFGVYLGLMQMHNDLQVPRKLFVVGHLENIFHCLPHVSGTFHTFDDFLEAEALDAGMVRL